MVDLAGYFIFCFFVGLIFGLAMYYVYVLLSGFDGGFYTGTTSDLKVRVQEHDAGLITTTRSRRPLELVYYEACNSRKDGCRRERYLKTTAGKRYLRNRLREQLETLDE